MNDKEIGFIMQKMSSYLDNSQLMKLEQTLEDTIKGEEIVPSKSSETLLNDFLAIKRLDQVA